VKLQQYRYFDDENQKDLFLGRSFMMFKEAFEEAEEREKVHLQINLNSTCAQQMTICTHRHGSMYIRLSFEFKQWQHRQIKFARGRQFVFLTHSNRCCRD
jgi:hypothetical protein